VAAHTSNTQIRDELISHHIQVLRFTKGFSNRMVALLNRAEPELRARLKTRLERIAALGWDPGPATTKRMIRTSQLIRDINRPTFAEINQLVRRELVGLSIAETAFISGVVTDALPVVFEPSIPSPRDLRGIVFARPFEKRILRDWLSTYELGDRRRMMGEIRQGLVFNETPSQIGRRIFGTRALGGSDGVREITRRGSQVLAQTATAAILNGVRSEFYRANKRIIRREQYVATLDSRTTPICQSLDGELFPVGEGPHPPIHINCRSIRVPVVDGRKLGKRPANRATERELRGLRGPARRRAVEKLVGPVPADQNYQTFLRNSPASFQDDVLGPARGRLFRSGELGLDRFVDNSGKRLTLRQLYDTDAGAFQRAGVAAPRLPGAPVPPT
jgi:SPP1 gp7 family putative phage head morphogenesis protein